MAKTYLTHTTRTTLTKDDLKVWVWGFFLITNYSQNLFSFISVLQLTPT